MPKFFISMEDVQGEFLTIREDAHHILHVLRKEIGDEITVCDGQGTDYTCCIEETGSEIRCRIVGKEACLAEPSVKITLFQGLPKAEKMEWVLQKGIELGICEFVPVMTERSVVKLEAKKAATKIARWNKIAEAAAKQCGRGILPPVQPLATFSEAVAGLTDFDLILVLYEEDREKSLKEILRAQPKLPEKIALWIGPEGGLGRSEVDRLVEGGAITAGLGPRILRTETAGMTAAALVLYEYDQM